ECRPVSSRSRRMQDDHERIYHATVWRRISDLLPSSDKSSIGIPGALVDRPRRTRRDADRNARQIRDRRELRRVSRRSNRVRPVSRGEGRALAGRPAIAVVESEREVETKPKEARREDDERTKEALIVNPFAG